MSDSSEVIMGNDVEQVVGEKGEIKSEIVSESEGGEETQQQGDKEEKKSEENEEESVASSIACESTVPTTPETASDGGAHMLESKWTLWFDKKPTKKENANYKDNLKQLGSFDSIEGFWNLYTYLKRPVDLPKDSNYHLFRGDAPPMWESFPNGGCWLVRIPKKTTPLSKLWEQLVFATIGEEFEDPDLVGIVVSIRKSEDVLALWLSDSSNQTSRLQACERLKQVLGLDPSQNLEYKNHSSSIRDRSTYRNGKKLFTLSPIHNNQTQRNPN